MTTNIRKLIIENQIHPAFQAIESNVSGQSRDDLHLLWSQFSYWERKELSGSNPTLIERNKIIYSLLQMVSELEENKVLFKIEKELSKNYEELETLNKKGEIDKFFNWLLRYYPEKFKDRLQYEKQNLNYPLLATFDNALLSQYIRENRLTISPNQLLEYISDKYYSMPSFLNEWLDYTNKRFDIIPALTKKIENQEKYYYKKLFIMGLLGGISGAALTAFFGEVINDNSSDFDEADD